MNTETEIVGCGCAPSCCGDCDPNDDCCDESCCAAAAASAHEASLLAYR